MLSYWVILALAFGYCWSLGLSVKCRLGNASSIGESEFEISSNLDSLPGYGPSEASLTGAGWCSGELLSTVNPYLQFNFSDVYAVYGGTIEEVSVGNVSSYVTSLQVEADILGTGEYYLIADLTNNIPRTTFNTRLNDSVNSSAILFNNFAGFGAKSIRIRPLTWSSSPPCMRIQLVGCLADIETVDVPLVLEPQIMITIGTVLAIALPIALVTILAVTVIAIISVICCYHFSHENRGMKDMGKHTSDMNEDQTIKHVKNDLYHTSRNRRFDESTNSAAYILSGSPQPYEVARASNAGQIEHGGIEKAYETVNLEAMNAERNRAPTQLEPKTEEGYETVGFEKERENNKKATIPFYATVTVEDAQVAGKKEETKVTYSSVQNPKELGYLNVQPKPASQLQEELGITESYGPEQFQV